MIQVKRVYDAPLPEDGFRVLVDRLWPRGLTKEKARIALWLKDIAPSADLIQRFHQGRILWQEFKDSYISELALQPQAVAELLDMADRGRLTLLFAARDRDQNQAIILAEFLRAKSQAS